MKLPIAIFLLLFTTKLFSQDLKTLVPVKGYSYDFGIEVQNDWKKRNQLLDDLENGKKSWDSLTDDENKLFEKYDETFESMWDVLGAGCSWYCGAGDYTVTASSELSSNGKINYNSKNLTDFSYQTSWVEGTKGYGIGDFINFNFNPSHPRVTSLIIANGYVKSKQKWKDNSRAHKLKMYIDNVPFAIIELQDIYAEQIVELKNPLGHSDRKDFDKLKEKENWNIKFEILSVYKGDKYEDTAISEIYFDGLDVHCLAKGTQITMADKTLKAIENLKVGDKILSFNRETESYEISVIRELASQYHSALVNLRFSNETEITCTKDHPILLNNTKWSSINPIKTEMDYQINNVVKLDLASKVKSLHNHLEIVEICEVAGVKETYTIVDLDKNDTFIANGIITGIERLRFPTEGQSSIQISK